MALQLNYNFDQVGIESSTAYAKIEVFSGNKENTALHVDVYINEAARNSNKSPLKSFDFYIPTPTGTGNDLLVDLYNYLKNNVEEFQDAIDC